MFASMWRSSGMDDRLLQHVSSAAVYEKPSWHVEIRLDGNQRSADMSFNRDQSQLDAMGPHPCRTMPGNACQQALRHLRTGRCDGLLQLNIRRRVDTHLDELRQMTLGQFMQALSACAPDQQVMFDFGDVPKGETQLFDCYTAHPSELAVGHRPRMNDDRMTSADTIMRRAEDAVGCTFMDQAGNEQTVDADTPLWAANWRERTGNAVVGVAETPHNVTIRTWKIE